MSRKGNLLRHLFNKKNTFTKQITHDILFHVNVYEIGDAL